MSYSVGTNEVRAERRPYYGCDMVWLLVLNQWLVLTPEQAAEVRDALNRVLSETEEPNP
jgi:hypothetical protein